MNRKAMLLIVGTLTVALCLGLMVYQFTPHLLRLFGSSDMDLSARVFGETPVHMTVKIYKQGNLILNQYHAGAVTKLGMNFTLAHITGNNIIYNGTQIACFLYWVSIGNQGTLDTDSTVLPGEWNRTLLVGHDGTYNHCNFTAIFYPTAGPFTADCIGLNFDDGIGVDEALFAYDTFAEVTGIDNTFTITVEFIVSLS